MGKPCALLSLTPGRRLGWGGPGLRRGGWILWLDPAREEHADLWALGSGGCGREPEPGSRACVVVNSLVHGGLEPEPGSRHAGWAVVSQSLVPVPAALVVCKAVIGASLLGTSVPSLDPVLLVAGRL